MARDKDELKKEYEQRHAISNTDQLGKISSTYGNGGLADQRINSTIGQNTGRIRGTTREQSGTIINAGSIGELDRGERVNGRTDEYGGRGPNQDTQRYGSMARGTEGQGTLGTQEPIDLPSDRIINVATTPQRGRGRPRKDGEPTKPKQEVRAVVVDVLKGADVETTRKRLRIALIGIFKAMDDFINLTLRDKPPQFVIIWTGIDDADIDTLVEVRIARAQHSVIEARVVKGIITVYEQFATGLITVPRMWQTYMAYNIYGFELPGTNMMPRARRRRNLRVVDNQQGERESGTTP